VPPVDCARWEATNTESFESLVHLTKLPRSIQPLAEAPPHATAGKQSHVSGHARAEQGTPPHPRRPAGKGCVLTPNIYLNPNISLTSCPHPPVTRDAPEHLPGRNAKTGKQSHAQGHATAELRPHQPIATFQVLWFPAPRELCARSTIRRPLRPNQDDTHQTNHQNEEVNNQCAPNNHRTGVLTCTGRLTVAI